MERKGAEEVLRESEERYRIVAQTATDAIITIDEQSTILFVNPSAEKIFGHQIVEMLGGKIWAESAPGSGSVFHFTIPLGSSGVSKAQ